MIRVMISLFLILSTFSCISKAQNKTNNMKKKDLFSNKTEEEWKKILTKQEYYVLRKKGTDKPSELGYTNHFEKGTYICRACKTPLFKSESKYKSHCGWPSFDNAIKGRVLFKKDTSNQMIRTEIICGTCNGHLGHIFNDGPKETTGKRYCVNTSSIKFMKK